MVNGVFHLCISHFRVICENMLCCLSAIERRTSPASGQARGRGDKWPAQRGGRGRGGGGGANGREGRLAVCAG